MRAHVVILLVLACSKEKAKDATPPEEKPTEQPVKRVKTPKPDRPADTSHGTCRIVASGAAMLDETLPHTGASMLNVMQWHTPEMRAKIGYTDEGIVLNCLGTHARINLLTPQDGKPAFPMKPATYELGKGGQLKMLGSIDNKSIMKTEGGKLEITAFDAKHIAGKVNVVVTKTLPASTGDITLAIDFDLQCWGLSGC